MFQAHLVRRLLFLTIGSVLLAHPSALDAATSITQYGITWTWQEDRQTGTFANGDYWVIGPITLTGITPASIVTSGAGAARVTAHGSMINPISGWWPPQGLDSRVGNYSELLNIARQGGAPLSPTNTRVVPASSSICSSTSRLVNVGEHSLLNDFAVLTVVATAPLSGSFRPPYIGTDKTIRWNASSLDYTILKNLPPATGMKAPTSEAFTRPWVHVSVDYNNARTLTATNNQIEYDRDIGWALAGALLELHQNYSNAQKETAYVRLVQYGIDVYAAMKYGLHVENGVTYPLQHGNTGPKSAVVLAALALHDSDIRFYADAANKVLNPWVAGLNHRWGPDLATAYISVADVGARVVDEYSIGRPRYVYTSQMVGLPEWTGASNWGVIYRNVRYSGLVGIALAMQLTTGAKQLWNWPAFFDYFDRAFRTYSLQSDNQAFPFYVVTWWNSYRSLGNAIWPQAAPVSGVGWIPQSGNTITIEYTDNVTTGAGGNGGLVVTASGGPVSASYSNSPSETQRTYALSRNILPGETATYSYSQPGNGVESLATRDDVLSTSGMFVVNYSTASASSSSGASSSSSSGSSTSSSSSSSSGASPLPPGNLSAASSPGSGGGGAPGVFFVGAVAVVSLLRIRLKAGRNDLPWPTDRAA